jgi:hypothetical protein
MSNSELFLFEFEIRPSLCSTVSHIPLSKRYETRYNTENLKEQITLSNYKFNYVVLHLPKSNYEEDIDTK